MNYKSFFAFAIVLVFTFVSCEDEPLEGNFISDNPDDVAGTFTAKVDGVSFIAASSSAVSSGGKTEITGFKTNGDIIVLTLDGTGTGSFDLSASAGEGNFGIDFDASLFTTNHVDGGGTVEVTEYSATSGRISGTFEFTAAMQLIDANGQPVLDDNGNPMYQMLEITEGQFTNVALNGGTIDDDEEGDIDLSVDITGLWDLAGYEYTGDASVEVNGVVLDYEFMWVGTDFNATSEFFENPNIVVSSGVYTTEVTMTFMGESFTETMTMDNSDEAEWVQNGTTITLTNSEMSQDYEIIVLTETTLKMYFERTEVIDGMETDIEGYITFTR